MAGRVYSGRFGNIKGCGQVTQWSVTTSVTDNAQSNSYTRAAKMRDAGVKDWNGSCTFYGKTFPGDFNWDEAQQMELYTGGAGWSSAGVKLKGDAVWSSIAFSGDISSGQRLQCQVSFSGSGPLTNNLDEDGDPAEGGDDSGKYRDTLENEGENFTIRLAKDCKIYVKGVADNDDEDSENDWTEIDWKSFNFSINNEAQELLDSTCFVEETEDVWKKRYPGIIDCTGSIDWVGDADSGKANGVYELKIECKGEEVFYVTVRHMGMGSYTVDPSSGSLIGGQSTYNMVAHDYKGNMGQLKILGITLFPPAENNN